MACVCLSWVFHGKKLFSSTTPEVPRNESNQGVPRRSDKLSSGERNNRAVGYPRRLEAAANQVPTDIPLQRSSLQPFPPLLRGHNLGRAATRAISPPRQSAPSDGPVCPKLHRHAGKKHKTENTNGTQTEQKTKKTKNTKNTKKNEKNYKNYKNYKTRAGQRT